MKTCMHNQMHRYVCDTKCMNDFYNPMKKQISQTTKAMSDKPDIARYKYGYKDDGWGQRYLSLIADADGSVIKYADHEASRIDDKALI